MTDTNTRIAELLGWVHGGEGRHFYHMPDDGTGYANFTTDLNLTVKEIERKGWCYEVSTLCHREGCAVVWPSEQDAYEGDIHDHVGPNAAEALALAFLAALESEASDD